MNYEKYKFVIALNKKLEPGVAMNAAAHIALGLVNRATAAQRETMKFIDYIDADGTIHPSISALSLIIMRGKPGELKKLKYKTDELGLLSVDFIQTMTGDTYKEQLERTKQTTEEEMIYYGVGVFGQKEEIDSLTKKLSLWK